MRPQTLRTWRLTGRGPAYVRLSASRVAYRLEALDQWLTAREFESTSQESARRERA
ncbi:MAG: hypothetical protein IT186_25605 [Acidobacteria bacterium]|nr:hypothetical protein [Acidobacteriota bacterium]